ncbi:MAG: hypothetical protein Q7S64_02870 [bacterium]|nr:hypothetical protein [bacterium]
MAKLEGKPVGWAVVAYILFFVPLLVPDAKENAFVKFHVKQGLVLFLFSVLIQVVGMMIPIIGWLIIVPLGGLASLVLFIIGIMNAINGKEVELPLIGSFAKSFNF